MLFPFEKNFLISFHQPEEEASSGGDQLASNKVDAYTVTGQSYMAAFIFYYRHAHMAKKTHLVFHLRSTTSL
jgi:hypothetical protein